MKIVDLNLLIYAVNRDSRDHAAAKEWWQNCLSDTETIGLPWIVLLGFLRLTTNTRVLPKPLSHPQAIDLIDEWLDQPPVQIITPTDRHWEVLKLLISTLGTASNLTTDAHIAAMAIEKGGVLYSSDNDFVRYPNLKWINPLL